MPFFAFCRGAEVTEVVSPDAYAGVKVLRMGCVHKTFFSQELGGNNLCDLFNLCTLYYTSVFRLRGFPAIALPPSDAIAFRFRAGVRIRAARLRAGSARWHPQLTVRPLVSPFPRTTVRWPHTHWHSQYA